MALLLLLLAIVPRIASSLCECGYTAKLPHHQQLVVFMDLLETDFTHVKDISRNPDWMRQQFNVTAEAGRGNYGKAFMPNNIESRPTTTATAKTAAPQDAGLGLIVGSVIRNNVVPAAEIDTKRLDLQWGSYRAGMKVTDINGTCAAFFWYFNDTQEIDVEFLSQEFDREKDSYPINLVIQSKESMEEGYDASKTGTFKRVNLTFDPTEAFHEYRFDYLPGQVLFYADSTFLAKMEGRDIPSTGGHLILQHWSNGNPEWSGGPPAEDATLTVSYVKAYFNSSDSQRHSDATSRCHDASADGAVCAIPDVIAANASTGGVFFCPNASGNGDVHKGGEEEESTAHSLGAPLWIGMVVTAGFWVL
ncbi:Fc.00g075960.m01.CDS01 [Cosmosporella sp. VM-42]